MSNDKIPTYRIDREDYSPSPGELISKAITLLLMFMTICVFGTTFSAFLLGVFVRVSYYVVNWSW